MQELTERNEKLIADRKSGLSYRELEEKYHISQNTITRIIYRYKIKEQLERIKK